MKLPNVLRLSEPSRVERLVLQQDQDGLTLILTVRSEHAAKTSELRFTNVTELRFRGENTALQEIILLLAEDLSSHGW